MVMKDISHQAPQTMEEAMKRAGEIREKVTARLEETRSKDQSDEDLDHYEDEVYIEKRNDEGKLVESSSIVHLGSTEFFTHTNKEDDEAGATRETSLSGCLAGTFESFTVKDSRDGEYHQEKALFADDVAGLVYNGVGPDGVPYEGHFKFADPNLERRG